ncbi:MAG: hypothetical protein EOM68_25980 [Spirochaetia bacterium]|nr:hypothetical protein [Spirochaetia bacterium]
MRKKFDDEFKAKIAMEAMKGIETRNLFAGNITKQPAYLDIEKRIVGSLENTDFVMNNTFFLGTCPGMKLDMIQYSLEVIEDFLTDTLNALKHSD